MWAKSAVVIGGGMLAGLLLAGAPAQAATVSLTEGTKQNALTAMHGEALAYARYRAFGAEAARSGQPRTGALFAMTADQELNDHFAAEAALIGFVRSNAENLANSIAGEIDEAYTMYPGYAKQAAADGCPQAVKRFTEIAADEAVHARQFATALDAVTHPGRGVTIPVGATPSSQAIPQSRPQCHGATQANLLASMGGESFAYAKYSAYAERARHSGLPRLARLFTNTAGTELGEHFAEEATLAGLVGPTMRNLGESISGETYEATTMYPAFARAAQAAGDRAAARLFHDISGDEAVHARRFARALCCPPM